MTIFSAKGNLITMAKNGDFDIIVHGCNCFNSMGGGIAYEMSKRCKNARDMDLFTTEGDRNKLGKISFTVERTEDGYDNPFIVVNAYTQYKGGPDFRIKAFRKCLKKIRKQFKGMNLRFGFPQIGAGIGGGNWDEILDDIQWYLGDEDVTIVEFDGSK